MKKSVLLICMVLGMCATLFAQETEGAKLPGYRTTFETRKFWQDWYVGVNFGGNALFAEHFKDAKFKNTITFMPAITVGKWFNPWWGVRLQGGGGALHGFGPGATEMLHMHYMYAHADFTFGLINFFAKYKENRKFDIVPFIGIGGMTRKKDQSFIIDAGIQARYDIDPRWSVNLEFKGMILDDDLVTRGGFPNDGLGGLSVGVSYRFNKKNFKAIDMDAIRLQNEQFIGLGKKVSTLEDENTRLNNEVDNLKNQNNRLTGDIQDLQQEIAKVKKAYAEESPIPVTIPFRFNRSKVDEVYQVLIYNLAVYMKNHPDSRVRIVGYADKFGTREVNLKISEKRAKAVAKILTDKYGIAADRIDVQFKGKDESFYKDDNKWNRCAVAEIIR